MDSTQTKASGARLTLITGTGGRPVDRKTVDQYCRSITACQRHYSHDERVGSSSRAG